MSVVSSGSATSPSFEDDYSFLPIDGVPARQVSSPRGPPSTCSAGDGDNPVFRRKVGERLRTFILLPSQFKGIIVELIRSFVGTRCVWCKEHTGLLVRMPGGEFDWLCIDCGLLSARLMSAVCFQDLQERPTVTPNLKPPWWTPW